VLFGTVLWQMIITAFKIREGMFDFDYIPEQDTMFASLRERPLFRFYVLAALGVPIALIAIAMALNGLSSFLAAIVHEI
jgi:hypothetical protein